MIKQIWIARCDDCGRVEPARMSDGVNRPGVHIDPVPLPPKGWLRAYPRGYLTCTECQKPQEELVRVWTIRTDVKTDARTCLDS